jgi:hypothetical protein
MPAKSQHIVRTSHWSQNKGDGGLDDTVPGKTPMDFEEALVAVPKPSAKWLWSVLLVTVLAVIGTWVTLQMQDGNKRTRSRTTPTQSTDQSAVTNKPRAPAPILAKADAQEVPVVTIAEQLVAVAITSQPSGATVTLLGKEMGITPLELKLKKEKHQIKLAKKGYTTQSLTLELSDSDAESEQRLVKLTPVVRLTLPVKKRPKLTVTVKKRAEARNRRSQKTAPKVQLLGPKTLGRKSLKRPGKKRRLASPVKIHLLDEDAPRERLLKKKKKPAAKPKIKIETLGPVPSGE